MDPAHYNLSIWEGGTFRLTITVYESDGITPENWTGYTGALNIYIPPSSVPTYTLSTSSGGITLGGAGGTIALYISSTDTESFSDWGSFANYELALTDSGGAGDVLPLLYGSVQVRSIH